MPDETEEAPEATPELEPEQDEATQIVNEIEKVKLNNLTLSREGQRALEQVQTRIRSLAGLATPEPKPEPDYKPEEPEEEEKEEKPEY